MGFGYIALGKKHSRRCIAWCYFPHVLVGKRPLWSCTDMTIFCVIRRSEKWMSLLYDNHLLILLRSIASWTCQIRSSSLGIAWSLPKFVVRRKWCWCFRVYLEAKDRINMYFSGPGVYVYRTQSSILISCCEHTFVNVNDRVSKSWDTFPFKCWYSEIRVWGTTFISRSDICIHSRS